MGLPRQLRVWCDLIELVAGENGLDPRLIAAVMLQESNGDPNALSTSGAVGLMQVMPSDGIAAFFTCENGPCFSKRPTIQELLDPYFNVSYGTRMLANLLAERGSEREALKAYGPIDVGYQYADIVLEKYRDMH